MPRRRAGNVAVGVARLGGDSGFIGRVGDDPFGRFMRHTLAQEQVDVNYMRLDAAQRTSTVVVDLDSHGERTFTFMVRPSADLFLQPEDLPPLPPVSGCTSAPSLSARNRAAARHSRRWRR
ncbi:fructokinase [Klebsiella pneumoniae]|uniref:Fructokinase n=1 Tax=Klebsiella pneumoniae TaxID=573 RepID=A0A2X3BVB6_KLEPN|nr:fructokinase [Klebsiella pneumoniae]